MKTNATRHKPIDLREELQKTVEAAADCSDTPEEFIAFMEACGYAVDCGIRRPYLQYSTSGEKSYANDNLLLSDYARYKLEKIFTERRGCDDCPRPFTD